MPEVMPQRWEMVEHLRSSHGLEPEANPEVQHMREHYSMRPQHQHDWPTTTMRTVTDHG